MLHLFTCHGRMMPRLAELLFATHCLDIICEVSRMYSIPFRGYEPETTWSLGKMS